MGDKKRRFSLSTLSGGPRRRRRSDGISPNISSDGLDRRAAAIRGAREGEVYADLIVTCPPRLQRASSMALREPATCTFARSFPMNIARSQSKTDAHEDEFARPRRSKIRAPWRPLRSVAWGSAASSSTGGSVMRRQLVVNTRWIIASATPLAAIWAHAATLPREDSITMPC